MTKSFYWFIGDIRIVETYYSDLKNNQNVTFISKDYVFGKTILSKLYKCFFSQRINSIIRMPFKKILFEYLIKKYGITDSFDNVLIFHEGWYDKDISRLLKKKYKRLKTVLYFDDTIETYVKSIPSLNPDNLNSEYDCVLVYNPSEAERYGFIKCNACFSKLNILNNKGITSDICFIGQPKDRYKFLQNISNHIGDKCKCNFIVVGDAEGIDHGIVLTKEYMSYEKYLENEVSSNCILELLKSDTEGATFRCWEAVYYNKKLLTNWKGIKSFEYYDPRYMRYFERPEEIDIEFITSKDNVDYHYHGENSPKVFLEKLEAIISGRKDSYE